MWAACSASSLTDAERSTCYQDVLKCDVNALSVSPSDAGRRRLSGEGLLDAAREAGIPLVVNNVGGMFGLFFTDAETVTCYQDVLKCDVERFKRFFHLMLEEGVYLAPSAFEAGFMSIAHTPDDINDTMPPPVRRLRSCNSRPGSASLPGLCFVAPVSEAPPGKIIGSVSSADK
ncbi:hypothetical protein UA70_27350 [Raoultella planticola]|nr:hypothetical protein UA70_27350 [Raoultella planticola]